MAMPISSDAFTGFLVLFVGLLFIAALHARGIGRRRTGVAGRGGGRLAETGLGSGRTRGRESDFPSLEAYGRQFEEAIEKIRLRRQAFRRGK
jgi:hypothetical protein